MKQLTKMQTVIQKENDFIRSWGGLSKVPEASQELNNLQREKIKAMKEQHGQSYIINLWEGDIFIEYTGQVIHNFMGFWVVNKVNDNLVKAITNLRNNKKYDDALYNIVADYIYNFLGGVVLCWK